jgi:hypothetical protein
VKNTPPMAVPNLHEQRTSGTRDAIVDAGFVVVLGALGLYSLGPVYGGWQYLAVGLVGLVLGVVVAGYAAQRRTPVLVEAVVTIAVFFVVGAVLAARSGGIPDRLNGLSHAGLYGWKELLTTSPPIGNSGNLLAIPYLLGLVGGVIGMSLARRTRRILLPVLGPFAILAIGILFGPFQPTSLFLQGTIFAGLSLAWMSVRHHRARTVIAGTAMDRRRILTAGGIVIAVIMVAGLAGPHLPGAASHQRTVLARYVVPPFQVSTQASPLAAFRQYATGGDLHDKVLFTIKSNSGPLPQRIRVAVMDSYDGISWGFGSAAQGLAADAFQRFGTSIPSSTGADSHSYTVNVGNLDGIWLPEAGQLSALTFRGPDAVALNSAFRYNLATASAAEPIGLRPGLAYTFTESEPRMPRACSGQPEPGASSGVSAVPSALDAKAHDPAWSGSATTACGKFIALASYLRTNGKFSDGQPVGANQPSPSLPGHGAGRLDTFFNGGGWIGTQVVGDDEQYAAALALLGRDIGIPTRVVLGAHVGPSGQVRGSDVHAWVEIEMAGTGWIPVYETSFMGAQPPTETPPTPQSNSPQNSKVPPPPPSSVKTPLLDPPPGFADSHGIVHQPSNGLIPGWVWAIINWLLLPLAAVALVAGLIRGVKTVRRRRRLSTGSPSERLAGAWNELIDRVRDLGGTVPARATRSEQAAGMDFSSASDLAAGADRGIFGPGDPSETEIQAYWQEIASAVLASGNDLTRWQRWKAALNVRSLVPMRQVAHR